MNPRIYLDWNATAPMRPAVVEAVCLAMRETGNASSVHAEGRAARSRIEKARRQIAGLVGCLPAEIMLTGSGTEANNAVLAQASWRHVLVSAIEHDSVRSVRSVRPDAVAIPVTSEGVIDTAWLSTALTRTDGPTLVSVMLANNETGVVQPVAEIVALAHAAGAFVHSDAVQAAGRIDVDCRSLGVDYLSLSAHKIGGPQGVGALVIRGGAPYAARQIGGGQERGRRAGTENVAGIVGFGVAAEISVGEISTAEGAALLRDRFEAACRKEVPEARVWGSGARRLPNTSCISMPGVAAQTQLMAFDLAGIAVSSGAACSSGTVRRSHVLAAMGAGAVTDAIRVSLGATTTQAEIELLIAVWRDLSRRKNMDVTQAVAA